MLLPQQRPTVFCELTIEIVQRGGDGLPRLEVELHAAPRRRQDGVDESLQRQVAVDVRRVRHDRLVRLP